MARAAYGARRNACKRARESAATQRRSGYPSPRCRQFAFVFPGQGSQTVGMGRDLAASSPAAAAVFAAADAALGEPISALAWEGPAERLDRTENAQPALLAASIAILEALRERWAADGVAAPARLRRRPLDGPVHGARRGRRRSRSRTASGSCATAAASCRRPGRAGTGRWPRSSASTTRGSPSWSPRPPRTACSSSPTATPRARSSCRASGPPIEAGAELARTLAPSARSSCRSPWPPTPRSWPRPPTRCARRSPASTFQRPDHAAARQRRRPSDHDRPTAPAPSSSSTSPPASTGSAPSSG